MNKTAEQVIKLMKEEMPFKMSEGIEPYLIEAIHLYASQFQSSPKWVRADIETLVKKIEEQKLQFIDGKWNYEYDSQGELPLKISTVAEVLERELNKQTLPMYPLKPPKMIGKSLSRRNS